jgi:hypothetical protein
LNIDWRNMMKKLAVLICSLALVFGVVGNAAALNFTVPNDSDVDLNNVWGWGSLTYEMASTTSFTLNPGDPTQTIDFFTLNASGSGGGYATINADLIFNEPDLSVSGSGGALWGSLGFISGGILGWYSQPDLVNIGGNVISIMFEQGVDIVCGTGPVTVHAYITNLGDGSVPVPEPGTMLMLGFVLLSLVGVSRKRFSNRN